MSKTVNKTMKLDCTKGQPELKFLFDGIMDVHYYYVLYDVDGKTHLVTSKVIDKDYYKLNFAVPDIPALKIQNLDKSGLLKPSSNDIFSFITSAALDFSNISLPKSYSAEISPVLMFSQNKSVGAYNTFKYSLRFSIA